MAGSCLTVNARRARARARLREAELNRREAALRRAEEAARRTRALRAVSTLEAALEARLLEVERRERELRAMLEAVEAQRERLDESSRSTSRAETTLQSARARSRPSATGCARSRRGSSPRASQLEDAGRPPKRRGTRPARAAPARPCVRVELEPCTQATMAFRAQLRAACPSEHAGDADGRAARRRRVVAEAARKAARSRVASAAGGASTLPAHGALAQLGERRLCKAEVTGSIPVRSIRFARFTAGAGRFADTYLLPCARSPSRARGRDAGAARCRASAGATFARSCAVGRGYGPRATR